MICHVSSLISHIIIVAKNIARQERKAAQWSSRFNIKHEINDLGLALLRHTPSGPKYRT